MTNAQLVDRKTLVQINATIIAGMLIFLTIGDFSFQENQNVIAFATITAGFLLLIISILICFATGMKGHIYEEFELSNVFKFAEASFVAGILFLFVTIVLVMAMKFGITV